jgi:hypothetical protein
MGDQAIRLSLGTVSVYPTTERKGRAKQLQIVLKPSCLELHKTLKDMRNGKTPKHLIDLSDLFNISLQNEPNQIKGDCISLMSPEVTYFILPNDPDSTLNDWFELLIERVREARSAKVLRPVFREEFFEAAWDITIVKKPKLRKDYAKDEKIDDLAEKLAEIQGRKRLCISATCFLLFKMGVHPSSDPDQPFNKEAYTELPINVISNYGKQERFFFVRVGRCSEIGQGELWMATEGGASAIQLHDKISKINQRDAEKRRQQGIVLSVGGLSSRTLKSTMLRQRARENKSKEAAKKAAEETVEEEQPQQNIEPSSVVPEPLVIPPPTITSPQFNLTRGESSKVTTPKKKVPFVDMAFKIGNKFHYNSYSSSPSTAGMFTSNPEYNKDVHDQSEVQAFIQPPPPSLQKQNSNEQQQQQQETPPARTLSPRNCYNTIAEDYMSYDAVVDSRKASAAQAFPIRQVSVMSGSESTNNMAMASAISARLSERPNINEQSDYLMMNNGFKIPDEPLRFPMKEARSYVSDISDSNESCYSSAAKRAKRESTSEFGDDNLHSQRTYSLGSKPPLTTMPIARDLSDLTTLNPTFEEFTNEDIRKRAHSAGSKTWSRGNYRKVMEVSTSDIRNRTNSFGTSTALSSLRRQRQQQHQQGLKCLETEDHAVIDFSDSSNKGSMASIDSPLARSRNSSIGIHATGIRNAAESAVASSNLIAEKLAAIKVEPSSSPRGGYDDSLSSSSSTNSRQSSSLNRRGSAPETSSMLPMAMDSDYVLMPGPIKPSRSSRFKTIPEKGSDTEDTAEIDHQEEDDDEDMEDLIIPKQAYVTGTALNQSGLEYAVIATSSAGGVARPAPPASALPLVQSFAPPLPIITQTSNSGGTPLSTPPINISTAQPSFPTSSPKHLSSVSPNANQNHCEYTVINPTTNK